MQPHFLVFILLIFSFLSSSACFDNLINPSATAEAKALYNYLSSQYSKVLLSGQTTFNYDDFVRKVQKHPLVRGFDMQNYSPHNPWFNWAPYDDGTTDLAIKWHASTNKKGIVTVFWHWFSPMGGQLRTSTFYTNYTDFDVTKAVTANTAEYNATIRDIDAISTQLLKFQANKIPVLWRPLHEAGGKWFWWGAKTNTACLALYRLIYDRMTITHKLNNLIWVWSTPESAWYPGNARVDMIGYDSYPGAYNYGCQTEPYATLKKIVGTNKMITLTENGPIPDVSCFTQKTATWGFWMGWSDLVFSQNSLDHIKQVYSSTSVVTLENANRVPGSLKNNINNSLRINQP